MFLDFLFQAIEILFHINNFVINQLKHLISTISREIKLEIIYNIVTRKKLYGIGETNFADVPFQLILTSVKTLSKGKIRVRKFSNYHKVSKKLNSKAA